jgi:hypothetical protein
MGARLPYRGEDAEACPLLPSQYQALTRGLVPTRPECRLMLALLSDAIVVFHRRRPIAPGQSRSEAERWIVSDDRRWPCSFVNVCEALGLAPDAVRRALYASRTVPARSPAARRRLLAGKTLQLAATG